MTRFSFRRAAGLAFAGGILWIIAAAAWPRRVDLRSFDELEWWIIRRERDQHTPDEWQRLIAAVAAEMYHVPPERLAEYARLRVQAMILRDERGAKITEDDWRRIGEILEQSWWSLSDAVRPPLRAVSFRA